MKLEDLQVEIRPRSPGQLITLAIRLLQERRRPLLVAFAFQSAGVAGLATLLLVGLEVEPVVAWCSTLLLASLFSAPVVVTASQLVFSPRPSWRSVLEALLRRGPLFALLFLAARAGLVLGLLLLIAPGLLLLRATWFIGPIALLEGTEPRATLRRSRRFGTGFGGHLLGHAALSVFFFLVLALAFGSMLWFLHEQVLAPTIPGLAATKLRDVYLHLVALLGVALASPFATLTWFLAYLDIRIRREGWDLELALRARAAELEGRRAA
jgi:hypothetical protein